MRATEKLIRKLAKDLDRDPLSFTIELMTTAIIMRDAEMLIVLQEIKKQLVKEITP